MEFHRIISSDNHIYEPPDLWESRVEPRFRDRCPRLVTQGEGQIWIVDNQYRTSFIGQGIQPGRRYEDPSKLVGVGVFEDVVPGGYVPEEALKDMDIDGVDVSILYPTVGLSLYYSVPDSDLFTALCNAYNDFMAEFCRFNPRRLKGIAMLNVDDVDKAVAALEHYAKVGLAGAMISIFPERLRYDSPEYDPLWAAAEDLQMPLSLHINTNRPGPDGVFGVDVVPFQKLVSQINVSYFAQMSLGDMIMSGVFERHPKLMVGAVELDLAWVPHLLRRMDWFYVNFASPRGIIRFKDGLLPSDVFHRNVYLSFQEDDLGIRLRDLIGVDNLMWGADYPHIEGTWPRSRQVIEEILADCTEDEKAKIVCENAAALYHLD